MNSEEERLIALLDEKYKWPSLYAFKFIVPANQEEALLKLVPQAEKTETRPSSSGKYLAFTFHCAMGSGREVLEVYAKVKGIEGLISL